MIDKYNDYKVNGVPRWIKSICSITFTSMLIALLVLLTTTIFAQNLTPDNFGYVSTYRRLCNLLSAIITGGFIISIPRYISFFHNKSRASEQATIFLSVTTSIIVFLLVALFLWIFKEPVTQYLGGGKDTVILIWSISLLLLTLVAEATIYAIFQGYQSLFRGNFLYLCSFGIIPLIYALNVNTSFDAKTIILWLAIIRLIFIGPIISFFYVRSIIVILKTFEEVRKLYREFLYFSFSRAIGGFGMMGIVSIGPILALSFSSSTDAGYLEISQNIISIIASLSIGVNIGLLTHISKLSSESEVEQIRSKVIITEQIALFLGIYLFLTIALFAKEIIILWVGAKYLPSILIIQISLLALIPYSIYTFLRGIIDADNVKPINTIITIVSFVEIVVLSLIMVHLKFGIYGILLSLLAGYFVLGVLTIIYTHRTYSVSFKLLGIWKIIFVNILLFLFMALEKFIFNDNIWIILIINIVLIMLTVFVYIKIPNVTLKPLKLFNETSEKLTISKICWFVGILLIIFLIFVSIDVINFIDKGKLVLTDKAGLNQDSNGYYWDIEKKVDPKLDKNGIPTFKLDIATTTNLNSKVVKEFYHPTAICLNALYQYNLYSSNNKDIKDKEAFLKQADWLTKSITIIEIDGKKIGVYPFDFDFAYVKKPWPSAITQGLALSVLSNAYKIKKNPKYLDTMILIKNSYLIPIEKGGITKFLNDDQLVFEEYIAVPPPNVLNGFILSWIGLYDYYKLTHDQQAKILLDKGINYLKDNLKNYDIGYWSIYDAKKYTISGPSYNYHITHIKLLNILYEITKEPIFSEYSKKWRVYINNDICLFKLYFALKFWKVKRFYCALSKYTPYTDVKDVYPQIKKQYVDFKGDY